MSTRKETLDELIEVAQTIFDRVEWTKGDFQSGVCRVHGERWLVLNRASGAEVNLRIVAGALSDDSLDQLYLLPRLREAIEYYRES